MQQAGRRYSLGITCLAGVFLLSACATTAPNLRSLRLNGDASTAYHAGDLKKSEKLYRELVALEPANAQAWYRLGNIALDGGRLEEAIGYYRRALDKRPNFPRAKHNLALAYFRRGAELLEDARTGLDPASPIRSNTDAFLLCLTAQLTGMPGLCGASTTTGDTDPGNVGRAQ